MSYRTANRRKSCPQDVVAHPRDAVPVLHRTLTQTNANNSKRFSFFPLFFTIFVRRMVFQLSSSIFTLCPGVRSHYNWSPLKITRTRTITVALLLLLLFVDVSQPTMYNLAPNHFSGDELLYISSLFHYSHTLLFLLRGALVSLLAHFDSTPTLDGMIAYRHMFSRTGPGVGLKENRV